MTLFIINEHEFHYFRHTVGMVIKNDIKPCGRMF